MKFSFEVRESDLLGRIGTLTASGKKVETPCLFPVVHPVRQAITTRELRAMGFKGLMTNSLIIHKRMRGDALAEGLHTLLDFDGMFMTDSGGYQALEYGEVDITYREIAAFQSGIGSDLAVTLDRPTGYTRVRKHAEDTVDYSLKNALATLKEFEGSETTWIGPVQGGLFADLIRRSAATLLRAGFGFLALGSPTQVMEGYHFTELVEMITAARRVVPYSVPLHLFGAGHPLTMAIAVALGCDTFDSASYILFARQGRYMTSRGITRIDQLSYLPCSCPACVKTSPADLREMEAGERSRVVALHNLFLLKTEVETCKEAISEGRLWDLVEERASVHPRLFEAFRTFARKSSLLQDGTRLVKDRGLMVKGDLDLLRPEVVTAANRLSGARRRDGKTALLIAGADNLPAGRLRSESLQSVPKGCDTYRIHPCFGAYPLELDFVYPFTQTVSTAPSNQEHAKVRAIGELRQRGYSRVIVAMADDSGSVRIARVKSRPKRKAPCPSPPWTSFRSR